MDHTQVHRCTCPICRLQGDEHVRAQRDQINLFLSPLDEQQRRWYAGLGALRHGLGGDWFAAELSGLSEKTVRRGRRELVAGLTDCTAGRVRHAGGGRMSAEEKDAGLEEALGELVEPEAAGDPQGAARYKRSSLRQLSARLRESGHPADPMTGAPPALAEPLPA